MGQLFDDFRKQIVACKLGRRQEFAEPQNQQRAYYFTPSLLDSMHLEAVIRAGIERTLGIPLVWIKDQECPLMFRASRSDPPFKKIVYILSCPMCQEILSYWQWGQQQWQQ